MNPQQLFEQIIVGLLLGSAIFLSAILAYSY
jgi:hypothetical protein